MTDILNLFTKLVEYYGNTAAIGILIVIIIVYGVYLILKNFSSIIKTYLENKIAQNSKDHASAAMHRKNVAPKIRSEIRELASEIKADRVMVFEYSNGSSNLVGLPFLHMTATYEVVTPGTESVAPSYQKLNTSIIAEFLEVLETKGYFYAKNLEEVKDIYPVMYNLLKPNNVNSILFYTLYGVDDIIGFVLAVTTKHHEFNRDVTLPRIAGVAQVVSSLLNYNELNEKLK